MQRFIKRAITGLLAEHARIFPVVSILGPRQSGKTTLAQRQFPDYAYANLELPDLRRLAEEDPRGFLASYPPPAIYDEIQRAPALLSYIQGVVDADRSRKGIFILTGSQQLGLRAAVSQSLAGRTSILTLLPLSLAELADAGIRHERDEDMLLGGLPQVHAESINPWIVYQQYFQTYIERDVRQVANIKNLIAFETFMRLLAGRVGQVANMADLSNSVGVSASTIHEWISILEASYILFRLPPYFENFGKRLIKSPKIYFVEPGLAAYLLDISDAKQAARSHFLGGLFENMVVIEALKARLNAGKEPRLYFLRDSNGLEIDLLSVGFESLLPIEIKASRTFSPDFCSSLVRLGKLDARFKPGIVVYGGDTSLEYKGMKALPYRDSSTLYTE